MTLRALPLLIVVAACAGDPKTDSTPTGTDSSGTLDSGTTEPTDSGPTDPRIDADADGFVDTIDCNDADPSVHPDASELCNSIDDDCDDQIDEDPDVSPTFYADVDLDGFGDAAAPINACAPPAGYVADTTDCDDTNADRYPGALELCNTIDDNCDDVVDEGVLSAFYIDRDEDSFGDGRESVEACVAPEGYVNNTDDCDDRSAEISPMAAEVCNAVDDDCDVQIDEDVSLDYYFDADRDGYGDPRFVVTGCTAPRDYVLLDGDCDDSLPGVYPGASETCNGIDDSCDGTIDEGVTDTFYADNDGDGYGDIFNTLAACSAPRGYVVDSSDCDDTDASYTLTCPVVFDGTVGAAWELRAPMRDSVVALQSFHPAGGLIYNLYPENGRAYDPDTDTWSTLTTAAPVTRYWNQAAPWNDQLYSMISGTIYRYDPASDSWATESTFSGSDVYTMTESDNDGVLYGINGDGQLVLYDTSDSSLDYVTLSSAPFEPRLGYDPTTNAIYYGDYGAPELFRYDIAAGTVTRVTSIPETMLNDIFCSDRSGHLYAAGDSSGTTMWQYTTATDTWVQIPDLPADHGNNSTCTVSEEGWLYVGNDAGSFYRLALY